MFEIANENLLTVLWGDMNDFMRFCLTIISRDFFHFRKYVSIFVDESANCISADWETWVIYVATVASTTVISSGFPPAKKEEMTL